MSPATSTEQPPIVVETSAADDGRLEVAITVGEDHTSGTINPADPGSWVDIATHFEDGGVVGSVKVIREIARAVLPNGAALLDAVRAILRRYLVLPGDCYYDVIALWIAHTHAIAAFDTTPRLVFKSAEKESGKTRALEVLELLVSRPLSVMNATVAAIFRTLKDEQVTVLHDEVDAIFGAKAANHSEDLRALLNAGYRRGAIVIRIVGDGKSMRRENFPVYAATALAAIGDLPDTIESRAVTVPMRRRAPDEQVEPFRLRTARKETTDLRTQLALWGAVHAETLSSDEPVMPDGVTDRAADIWEPLLAIADLAGSDWPKRARDAAVAIVKGRVAEDASVGVRLLADIKAVMGSEDRISSATLCERLNALDEAQWSGWNADKGIRQRDLARRLKPYGTAPRVIKLPGGSTPRGYHRDDLADAWARYLRDTTPGSATSATSATPIRIQVADVAEVADTDGDPGGPDPGNDLLATVLTTFPGSAVTKSTRKWADVPDDHVHRVDEREEMAAEATRIVRSNPKPDLRFWHEPMRSAIAAELAHTPTERARPSRGGELAATREAVVLQRLDEQRRQRAEALRLGLAVPAGRWS